MAVHIRLTRGGSKHAPVCRVVVTDHRAGRDGRFIETIGTFDPNGAGKFQIDRARLDYWRGHGALPSATVAQLIKRQDRATPAATA